MKRLRLAVPLLALPALAFAQGQLTPPDSAVGRLGPVPTMKTLDQVEPRIPIQEGAPGVRRNPSTGGFAVEEPGTYYLTGNLTVSGMSALQISSRNVTVELNGFVLSTSGGTGYGIEILSDDSVITIRNGKIASGFFWGIKGNLGPTVVVEDVSMHDEGVATAGIQLGANSVVRRCTVVGIGGTGIVAGDVIDSHAYRCGGKGISASGLAQGCSAEATTGDGLRAQIALNCSGTSDAGSGISVVGAATNCTGTSTAGTGLSAQTATGCTGTSTSGIGLLAEQNATGCTGITATGTYGLHVWEAGASGTAENCRGIVTGGTGTGLATEVATNCFGQSTAGTGLAAASASNCSAYTASGNIAMSVAGTANSCRGNNGKTGGTAIQATIVVSCTSAGGTIAAPYKYNMP